MPDFDKANLASFLDTDKIVEVLTGTFTYSYNTFSSGGVYVVDNPQSGNLFLPFSIFSTDGGNTWFGDLEGDGVNNYPDMMTVVTTSQVKYKWNNFGPSGSFTVMYKTALLAMQL